LERAVSCRNWPEGKEAIALLLIKAPGGIPARKRKRGETGLAKEKQDYRKAQKGGVLSARF